MRIFFDTEFTALADDAGLISIGLVDEAGVLEFYAELTDTYARPQCSAFCVREVLPHLEGGPSRCTLEQLRRRLPAWLEALGEGAVLVCDSPRDVVQLQKILPDRLPTTVRIEVMGFWDKWRRRFLNRGHRIHRAHGLRVHHALDDARVNRLVFAASGPAMARNAPVRLNSPKCSCTEHKDRLSASDGRAVHPRAEVVRQDGLLNLHQQRRCGAAHRHLTRARIPLGGETKAIGDTLMKLRHHKLRRPTRAPMGARVTSAQETSNGRRTSTIFRLLGFCSCSKCRV